MSPKQSPKGIRRGHFVFVFSIVIGKYCNCFCGQTFCTAVRGITSNMENNLLFVVMFPVIFFFKSTVGLDHFCKVFIVFGKEINPFLTLSNDETEINQQGRPPAFMFLHDNNQLFSVLNYRRPII